MFLLYYGRTVLLTACLALSSPLIRAQTLLRDIAAGPTGSAPSSFVSVGTVLYFIADDGIHGRELWKSDGTTDGTVLVKDINPGPKSADIQDMVACNGLLFFSAFSTINNSNARQLWRSDGTDAGTFEPDDGHKDGEVQQPINLTKVGNTVFYVTKGSLGGTDQWHLSRSDGTNVKVKPPGGTGLFFSFGFSPATDGNHPPTNFTDVNGTLFFTYKGDLYKTTGSATDPGVAKITAVPKANRLISYRNKLYFVAGIHKSEIWTSGGTAETTVKWGTTGTDSIVNLTSAGSYLYFVTGSKQATLWVGSPGMKLLVNKVSPANLAPVKLITLPVSIRGIRTLTTLLSTDLLTSSTDITCFIAGNSVYSVSSANWKLTKLPGTYKTIEKFVGAGGRLYFLDATGLYQISGTVIQTVFTTTFSTAGLISANGRLYFSHFEPNPGLEPCYVATP